jgi:hypothetical protein
MQVILVDPQPVSADGSDREVPVCPGVICVCNGPDTAGDLVMRFGVALPPNVRLDLINALSTCSEISIPLTAIDLTCTLSSIKSQRMGHKRAWRLPCRP